MELLERWGAPAATSSAARLGRSPQALPSAAPLAGQVSLIARRARLVRAASAHAWVTAEDAGAVVLGAATAMAEGVVVRMPGEHPVDGRAMPAEVQVRYRAADGRTVVVAVGVDKGPSAPGIEALLVGTLDVHGLLAHPRELLRYDGVDTVPPFTEPVTWLVARTPTTARTAQLVRLLDGMPLPPRPVRAGHGEPVTRLDATVLAVHDGRGDVDGQGAGRPA